MMPPFRAWILIAALCAVGLIGPTASAQSPDAPPKSAPLHCAAAADCPSGMGCWGGICKESLPLSCIPRCAERDRSGKCTSFGEDFCAPGGGQCEPSCAEYRDGRERPGGCLRYGPDTCKPLDPGKTGAVNIEAEVERSETPYGKNCPRPCLREGSFGRCAQWGAPMCGATKRALAEAAARPGGNCVPVCLDVGSNNECVVRAEPVCLDESGNVTSGKSSLPTACARRCVQRDTGGCRQWGEQVCGEPGEIFQCAARCATRDTHGLCTKWGADHCGDSAQCQPHCTKRDAKKGALCLEWGEDSCSPAGK